MKRLNQNGSHLIVIALALVAVALAGFTGYRVMQARDVQDTATANGTSSKTVAPTHITSEADLTQAAKALDDSSAQLNASLNDTALDGDLNDLL